MDNAPFIHDSIVNTLQHGFANNETIINKGSFPLIAKANSQARCENFHPITICESTRCELAFAMSGKDA